MSFRRGQKVCCVDDCFEPVVEKLYAALPKEGEVYIIRDVFSGRSAFAGGGAGDAMDAVLLKDLLNPKDPRHLYGRELGFGAWRFRPLEELTDLQRERYGIEQEVTV